MDQEAIEALASKIKKRLYTGVIHAEGQIFDRIFVVAAGEVKVKSKSNEIGVLEIGQYFGDIGLFIEHQSSYSYIAEGQELNVTLYELELYQIVEILGPIYLNKILESIFLAAAHNAGKLKNHLLGESLPVLLNVFRLEFYERNRTVYSKNLKINKKICILISGKLVMKSDRSQVVACAEQLFGEDIIDSVNK